jgi:rRNA-processing protein FCF1
MEKSSVAMTANRIMQERHRLERTASRLSSGLRFLGPQVVPETIMLLLLGARRSGISRRKFEQRTQTFSNFETQGKERPLLDYLMRSACRLPPAECLFLMAVSQGRCEVSTRDWNLNDRARLKRRASIVWSFSYAATML